MDELLPKEKKAITLYYWENYTIEEVARSLRLSWGMANTLIESGHESLKKILLDSNEFNPPQRRPYE